MKKLLSLFILGVSISTSASAEKFSRDEALRTWDILNQIEYREGIPQGLIQSMGLVESGHKFDGQMMPWPYAVNVNKTMFEAHADALSAKDEVLHFALNGFKRFDLKLSGKRHYGLTKESALGLIRKHKGEILLRAAGISKKFNTKEKAVSFVQQMKDLGLENIDVGVMQVNLKYHGQAFASLDEAFDPYTNIDYAVSYLMKHRQTRDWWASVGRYHSGTGLHAKRYVRTVYDMYQLVHGKRG